MDHCGARVRVYRVIAMLVGLTGCQAVLFGGFLRRLVAGEALDCDLDIYASRYITCEQINHIVGVLRGVGWCQRSTMLRPYRAYQIGVRRMTMRVDGVVFDVDLSPQPPPTVDFDVCNLEYRDGAVSLRVPRAAGAGDLLDTLCNIRERTAHAVETHSGKGWDDQVRLLRRQRKVMRAGYEVYSGYMVAPLPTDDVCPIVHEHTAQAVMLECGHSFDIDAVLTLVDVTPKPRCPVCRGKFRFM